MKLEKKVKWAFALLVLINLGIIALVFLAGDSTPETPLPNPNGYDDFVKAGHALVDSQKLQNYQKLNHDELATVVATNAESLKLLRTGLSNECRVPISYSHAHLESNFVDVAYFKSLTMLVCAEGRLKELEGHTNEAAQACLDGVHLGQESTRGGLLLHGLVRITCEAVSLKQLQPLASGLNASQSREIARSLAEMDGREEPIQETLDRESVWMKRAHDLRERFLLLLNRNSLKSAAQKFSQKAEANTLHRRQVMAAFAARAYTLEKGAPPKTINDLVPDYLKTIPQDPTTKTNLVLPP